MKSNTDTERELKKYLKALAVAVTEQVAELDAVMKAANGIDRGREIARIANKLNASADSAMHFGLHMDFKDINKIKRKAERDAPHYTVDLSSRFGTSKSAPK